MEVICIIVKITRVCKSSKPLFYLTTVYVITLHQSAVCEMVTPSHALRKVVVPLLSDSPLLTI